MEKCIPQIAYRFIPTGELLYKGSKKSIKRYIFYNTMYTEYEENELKAFKIYIQSKIQASDMPEYFNDAELLRILIGCKFVITDAFHLLLSEIE